MTFLPQELIRRKRDGEELAPEEIEAGRNKDELREQVA